MTTAYAESLVAGIDLARVEPRESVLHIDFIMPENEAALILGCGYLGQRVGERLLTEGVRVTATTRGAQRKADLEAHGFSVALLDLAAPENSEVWRGTYDTVIYCVAGGRDGDPLLAHRDGALLAARHLQTRSLRRFLYVSSTGVYAQRDGSELDEDSEALPKEERPRVIREAEEALLRLAAESRFPVVILRLGGLYGPGRSPLQWLGRPEFRARLERRGREAYSNWVHVDDAADGVVLAAQKASPGETYLIVDGAPVRRGEFFNLAAELASQPPLDLCSDPSDLGKRLSNAKARQRLGFMPRHPSYREGLKSLRESD